ncbi:MAG: carbon storage regulator CsrA [Planctomycetaceae bacterium]|jgi:carbon storage regulator|nr:carbon storage regulator CsrA [Planctomycetaceae bacterium]
MLVLTRKLDQSIQIGDDVTITILAVKGNTVRIGISAPDHVRIARRELHDKLRDSGVEQTAKTPSEAAQVSEMEVIEIQSRPNASIKIERLGASSQGGGTRVTPPQTLPPLHSRLPMFSDGNYETHHLRIRMEEPQVRDVSQT